MAGIYLHIPFCKKACHYCNFHFSTSAKQIPEMVQAIMAEAEQRRSYLSEPVETVYFGGGTPSLLDNVQLYSIINSLKQYYNIAPGAEITLEANPDDISGSALNNWKEAGINRLSIGVQSFFDEDLRWMNRAHSSAQSLEVIALAQAHGFSNITIDLIYGVPGLSDDKWKQNIDTALHLGIPHLSCYALTVEPRTTLEKMIEKHEAANVDADQQARQFEILVNQLSKAGFEHYEISNFAKPGFRSRHNSSYWQGKFYIGLGPSAHSFNGNSRQWNIANNAIYVKNISARTPAFEQEVLTPTQQLNEYIMISLRTIEGLSLDHISSRWDVASSQSVLAAAQKHVLNNHLRLAGNVLQLTEKGKFLADGIAADLFADPE